jgi:hypothetical protein
MAFAAAAKTIARDKADAAPVIAKSIDRSGRRD